MRLLRVIAGAALFSGTAMAQDIDLPDAVIDYMMNPPDEVFSVKEDGYWLRRSVPVTPEGLGLIRKAVLVLDPVESGAPKFSGKTPFGSDDPWGDVRRAFGTSNDAETAAALLNFTNHLSDFVERAVLAPGTYAMQNITADDLRREFAWLEADDTYLGLTPDGKVIVTEDHLKLLRGMYWEWPNEYGVEDALAFGEWPMPAVDGKRPYGDMSFYQLDVHRLLGWPIELRTDDGYIKLTEQQIEDGARLHTQMLGVTQVFLERAELPD